MDGGSSHRLRLQVVIATENAEGQNAELRKFLLITKGEKTISSMIAEVNEKFRKLYPAER